MEVDRHAHRFTGDPEFVTRNYYATVNFFLEHHFRGSTRRFAYVNMYRNIQTDAYGFANYRGAPQFETAAIIETSGIGTVVGLITNSSTNTTYILDRDIINTVPTR